MLTASPRNDTTRRRLLAGIGALGLLAACRSSSDETARPAPTASRRSIAHAMGTADVPLDPTRIVVTNDYQDLDAVLAVGLVPVAFGYFPFATEDLPPWAAAALGSRRLRTADGLVNLEEVAQAEPDLIVGSADFLTGTYDELTGLAPTVALDVRADWREPTLLMGRATGREDRAAAAVAAAEGALTAGREALARDLNPLPRVAVLNLYGGEIGIAGPDDAQGRLLEELGIPQLDPGRGGIAGQISQEELGLLDDADVVLIEDFTADETAELLALPLFEELDVVRDRRVMLLDPVVTRAAYLRSALSTGSAVDGYVAAIRTAAAGEGSLVQRSGATAPPVTASPSPDPASA